MGQSCNQQYHHEKKFSHVNLFTIVINFIDTLVSGEPCLYAVVPFYLLTNFNEKVTQIINLIGKSIKKCY